ncbi:MAG: M20/M25/M40 family metallo-hydrolase, partial [Tumebacillaceae bacterium]
MELNEKQIVDHFLELVKIDAVSHFERPVADYLLKYCKEELKLEVTEDKAGNEVIKELTSETKKLLEHKPQTGNVIAKFKGTIEGAPALLFTAHMDTVVANPGIQTHIDESNIIRTDGKTILGADDRAGVCAILEACKYIQENNIPHGDLYFAFTIAEETGLFGSKYLDTSKMNVKCAFVMDSGGPPDTIINAAPTEV